jgi:hypothetical protein
MTKSEFKEAMKRGLGRCVIELNKQTDIEKYRDIVLWGCLHNLAYDTQCEGTRAEYMYVLQSKFEGNYFEPKILEKYKKLTMDSWLFDHYTEMLYWFASNGSNQARKALYDKLNELLEYNAHKKQHKSYRPQREQFEWLCIWLTTLDGFAAFKKIVECVGEAYEKYACQDEMILDWFYANSQSKFGKSRIDNYLSRRSSKSPHVHSFRKETEKYSDVVSDPPEVQYSLDRFVEECKKDTSYRYRIVSRRFAQNASEEELKSLAGLVIFEPDDSVKAKLLSVFCKAKFPLDINIVIDYSKSGNEDLQNASFQALENNPSKIVHDYAIGLLLENKDLTDAIQLLCKNFQKADAKLLVKAFQSIPVTYEGNWHGAYIDVLGLCESNRIDCRELLLLMFENTLCSFCRESIVRALKKHKLLTEDIRNECKYDSNANIRSYIIRYVK